MLSHKRDARITYFQYMLCGGAAGVVSKTATAPLDVIKIRTQVGAADARRGFFNAGLGLYSREGIRAFWKGNLMGCLRLMPHSVIQLTAFHKFQLLLSDSCGRLTPLTAMIAGSGAGAIATVALYPTDTIKTRLIMQHVNPRWSHYHGIFDAFRVITRDEGFRALYRGVSTSLLGMVPYSGSMFFAYEVLDVMGVIFSVPTSPVSAFVKGCIASTFASFISYPFDTIRKKMQAYSPTLPNKGETDIPRFRNMRDAFKKTIKIHGVFALWRGMLANMLKVCPYTGIMFLTYEQCKKRFLYYNGFTLSPLDDEPHPFVDQSLLPSEVEEMWEELGPEHLNDLGLTTMADEEGGSEILGHKPGRYY